MSFPKTKHSGQGINAATKRGKTNEGRTVCPTASGMRVEFHHALYLKRLRSVLSFPIWNLSFRPIMKENPLFGNAHSMNQNYGNLVCWTLRSEQRAIASVKETGLRELYERRWGIFGKEKKSRGTQNSISGRVAVWLVRSETFSGMRVECEVSKILANGVNHIEIFEFIIK